MKFIVFILILVNGVLAQSKGFYPMDEALEALKSDDKVTVKQVKVPQWKIADSFYLFSPVATKKTQGFILYPGARVDARSYAPLLRNMALRGIVSVLINMPYNNPTLGLRRAKHAMKSVPEINQWIVGGHSLGGTSAATFVKYNVSKVNGLILWASYPSKIMSLRKALLPVLSIYGDHDGLTTIEDIDDHRDYLPISSEYHLIAGANHTGFGSYGDGEPQEGDNYSSLSLETQHQLIVDRTVEFIESL